jgi:hypothetical protein
VLSKVSTSVRPACYTPKYLALPQNTTELSSLAKLTQFDVGLVPFLAILVFAPIVLPAHAVPYKAAVTSNEWARYVVLADSCKSNIPAFFCGTSDNMGLGFLNNTASVLLRVARVSGKTISFNLVPVYDNGTVSQDLIVVDFATGTSNFTIFTTQSPPSDFFIVAGGLTAPDPIWKTHDAPAFNLTTTESVIGVPRKVDFFNYTRYQYFALAGNSWHLSVNLAFDEQSGFIIDLSISNYATADLLGSAQREFVMHMDDNNIWASSRQYSMTNLQSSSQHFKYDHLSASTLYFQTGVLASALIIIAKQRRFPSAEQIGLQYIEA